MAVGEPALVTAAGFDGIGAAALFAAPTFQDLASLPSFSLVEALAKVTAPISSMTWA
jgi:hypothetical protein